MGKQGGRREQGKMGHGGMPREAKKVSPEGSLLPQEGARLSQI